MQEDTKQTVELTPDKDGFLFEIVDDLYILSKLLMLLCLSIILLVLMIIKDFEVMNFAHSGYRGHYIVYLGIPWMILEIIRIIYYFYKKEYKKIKFYETYILKTNKNIKVELKDIKEGYITKCNFSQVNRPKKSFIWIMLVIAIVTIILDYRFAIVWSLFVIYVFLICMLSRYIYSLYKKSYIFSTDILTLMNDDKKLIVGIPLQTMNHEDKKLFESYIKKHFNKNIDEFERCKFTIPIYKTENLINRDTILGENE